MKQKVVYSIFFLFFTTPPLYAINNDLASASENLSEYIKSCNSQQFLWQKSLCVPMIMIDRHSKEAISNEQPSDQTFKKNANELFSGSYKGPEIFANTSIDWDGKKWSTVIVPLPKDKQDATELIYHEAWHSIQNDIGFPPENTVLEHMDFQDARTFARLEWAALLNGLISKKYTHHLKNALYFRSMRFEKYPEESQSENRLDLNEGLAAYTGFRVATKNNLELIIKILQNKVKVSATNSSLSRSLSYTTGPLYGAIFDQIDSSGSWRQEIKNKNFQSMALKLLKIEKLKLATPTADEMQLYGEQRIQNEENIRNSKRNMTINKLLLPLKQRSALILEESKDAKYVFNPNSIYIISKANHLYESYESLENDWGNLRVSSGVLIKLENGKKMLHLSPPTEIRNNSATGYGWGMQILPGWKLTRQNDGNWIVAKK